MYFIYQTSKGNYCVSIVYSVVIIRKCRFTYFFLLVIFFFFYSILFKTQKLLEAFFGTLSLWRWSGELRWKSRFHFLPLSLSFFTVVPNSAPPMKSKGNYSSFCWLSRKASSWALVVRLKRWVREML